ncbi:hypothetical protein ACFL1A_02990 [Patescibacteria group bacterium]
MKIKNLSQIILGVAVYLSFSIALLLEHPWSGFFISTSSVPIVSLLLAFKLTNGSKFSYALIPIAFFSSFVYKAIDQAQLTLFHYFYWQLYSIGWGYLACALLMLRKPILEEKNMTILSAILGILVFIAVAGTNLLGVLSIDYWITMLPGWVVFVGFYYSTAGARQYVER